MEAIVKHNSLPNSYGEGITDPPARRNKYGESIFQPYGPNTGVEEGTRHVATNPTMGTGIATTTSIQTYDTTKPVMMVINPYGLGGANIIFDYLRLIATAAAGSSTDENWAMQLSAGTRYASAGTAIVPVPLNTGASKSGAVIFFGAPVAAAALAADKFIHRSKGRSVIPVAGDETLFKFGSTNHEGPTTLGGAVALRMPIPCGPVVLRPGDTWLLHHWQAASAGAPAWEFEFGYTER